ncbi:hypothetical protein C0993_004460 [Termitomyces sp. T159_Od127]|nr:hypothetical protein C0993_004460 [Termitomyces sp. T159_Od127]
MSQDLPEDLEGVELFVIKFDQGLLSLQIVLVEPDEGAMGPVGGDFVVSIGMLGIDFMGDVDFVLEELVEGLDFPSTFTGHVGGDVTVGKVHVWSLGKGVGLSTKSAGVVKDGEVVLGEYFEPVSLAVAGLLDCGEVLEVVVVQVDLNLMQGALEVSPLLFEGFDNGEELFVINAIVELYGDHQVGVEGNGLELVTTEVHLEEYTGNGIVRGITFKYDGKGGVEVAEDGGRGEGFLEESEYTLASAVPVPWGVLSHELVEGFGDSKVVINELAVEVGETKKGLYLFYVPGQRPVENGLHFSRVHENSI